MAEHDENRDAYRELILEKIENIHDVVNDQKAEFQAFTAGIGPRLGKVENKVTHLETSLGIMAKIMWLVVAASITTVVGVIWKLILK